ncbi:MAG: methyltransferase domain-containing protein [Deltaproteobacteria bacterium]|nr:methyltransferase domain-containing protein [Deltaproteobacteria bacterium]
MKKEVEVFGVTYDRYVLLQLHKVLTNDLQLETVVEMPSHGAKAAGSLYSIGFGLAGCDVTLVNAEQEMMVGWEELGISDRVNAVYERDVYNSGFDENQFDLAWNFVTWTELENPALYLEEMKRISKKYVLLVTCNNFQPGYPWHRLIHKIFGFPWTHGNVAYNHMTTVKRMFKNAGFNIIEYGAIDTPGWPDPSGPRDIRLHRKYGTSPQKQTSTKPDWEVPIITYAKTGQFPGWMKALGKWDMAFRKGLFKLPMSHLFYVIGQKQ